MTARRLPITLPATFILLMFMAAPLHAASVRLTWIPPTTNANGTALNDLAGYKVYHGSSSRQYTASVDVGNVTSYTLSGLTSGRLYYIAVTASDTSGNESVYSAEIPVTPTDTPPPGAPVANFTATPTLGSAPLQVAFTDTSTASAGSISSWSWTFGVNGATSTARNPTYTYQTPGSYTVSLTVRNSNGATNTVTKTGFVTVHRTGLVAAYGFNESSGATVNDVSGRGNHGTVSGATRTSSGRYGRALNFDGTNDWVTVNDAASLDLTTGMTLEAWVYPTATPTDWRSVIMKERPGNLSYSLTANSDRNQPATTVFVGSGRTLYGGSQLAVNTWTHLAATYDGTTQRLYVNGSQVASRPQSGGMQVSSGPLRVGGNSVWGQYFRGRIDEVRVYNRALSASEIQSDRNSALPTPSATAPSVARSQVAFEGDEAWAGLAAGVASVTPKHLAAAETSVSASAAKTASASSELLVPEHLEIGEVEIDQAWKRVELRQQFVDPVVVAKALSYREAHPAVVRIRQVTPTGFEISLQPWDDGHSSHAPEAVGYLVIERGRFRLADGTAIESGTVDTDPAYPRHSIAFSRSFRVAPVVMTAVSSVQDADAVTGRPTRVSKKGFQFHTQRQGLAPSPDAAQTLSFVAWEPSAGSLDGLVFEVNKTGRVRRDQFSTIAFQETFPVSPVFLADLQASGAGSPLNLRWGRKDLAGVDVKIDAAQDLERGGAEPQDAAVVGYILIR
jgi:PKD repeat protein